MSAPRRENDAKRKVTFNTTDAGGHVKLVPQSLSEKKATERRHMDAVLGGGFSEKLGPDPATAIKIDSKKVMGK